MYLFSVVRVFIFAVLQKPSENEEKSKFKVYVSVLVHK